MRRVWPVFLLSALLMGATTPAIAVCASGIEDLGTLTRVAEFTGRITGGNSDFCVAVNVGQAGCYRFHNISQKQPQLRGDILTPRYERELRFLAYTDDNGIRPKVLTLLDGPIIIRLQYLGHQGGAFHFRISRVPC